MVQLRPGGENPGPQRDPKNVSAAHQYAALEDPWRASRLVKSTVRPCITQGFKLSLVRVLKRCPSLRSVAGQDV